MLQCLFAATNLPGVLSGLVAWAKIGAPVVYNVVSVFSCMQNQAWPNVADPSGLLRAVKYAWTERDTGQALEKSPWGLLESLLGVLRHELRDVR